MSTVYTKKKLSFVITTESFVCFDRLTLLLFPVFFYVKKFSIIEALNLVNNDVASVCVLIVSLSWVKASGVREARRPFQLVIINKCK